MEPMELVGTEYLPKTLLNRIRSGEYAKLYWDEIPAIFMATEADLRPHREIRVGTKLKKVSELDWNGCGRAVVERRAYWKYPQPHPYYASDRHLGNTDGILFRRCSSVADSTGFCKQHKARAIKDGRVSEVEDSTEGLLPSMILNVWENTVEGPQ